MGILIFSSYWAVFIGLLTLISMSVKNTTSLKSLDKLDSLGKIVLYSCIISLILGFILTIISIIDPLNLLRKEDKFSFFDDLKIVLLCGGLTWFFWSAHQNKKFELKLPKILDLLQILLIIFICLGNIYFLFLSLKILPFKEVFFSPDDGLIYSSMVFIIPYISFIFGVNSIAKSKNRDSLGWTIISVILLHPIITFIIITLLGKIEKPKFK
jgi:hypothetical protein